jgi:hypothetical protein
MSHKNLPLSHWSADFDSMKRVLHGAITVATPKPWLSNLKKKTPSYNETRIRHSRQHSREFGQG